MVEFGGYLDQQTIFIISIIGRLPIAHFGVGGPWG